MTLSELQLNAPAIIEQVQTGKDSQSLVRRLAGLGITTNKSVRVLRKASWGGPLHILVGTTTEVAIRRRESDQIVVRPLTTGVSTLEQ